MHLSRHVDEPTRRFSKNITCGSDSDVLHSRSGLAQGVVDFFRFRVKPSKSEEVLGRGCRGWGFAFPSPPFQSPAARGELQEERDRERGSERKIERDIYIYREREIGRQGWRERERELSR